VCLAACASRASDGQDVLDREPGGTASGAEEPISEEPAESYELALPVAGTLPLDEANVLRLSDAREIDLSTAWEVDADGFVRGTFDRSDIEFSRSRLWSFSSPDGKRFSRPRLLEASNAAFVGSPSLVAGRLYFVTSSSMQATPTLHRWEIDAAASQATKLPRIPGVDWLLSWPKFTRLDDGAVAVAFRDGTSVPRFALSPDGTKFAPSVAVAGASEQGAMPALGAMSDGTLAFTFQQESTTESMISYVVLSHDRGATWSERIRVSEAMNVHDTSSVRRADGAGIDLYYIHPEGSRGFSLFRRSLGPHGGLGLEERVTSAEVGEPSKPSVVRRKDGRLVVAWSEIAERSEADFAPIVQQVVLAELASDAPR
jgi:hypothetical protein